MGGGGNRELVSWMVGWWVECRSLDSLRSLGMTTEPTNELTIQPTNSLPLPGIIPRIHVRHLERSHRAHRHDRAASRPHVVVRVCGERDALAGTQPLHRLVVDRVAHAVADAAADQGLMLVDRVEVRRHREAVR